MAVQFRISALASTLAEGGTYTFTLTPQAALSGALDVRWVIVPKGKVPITANDFSALTGTASFASSATAAQTVTITPTDDSVVEVSGEFEIQVYQVVSGGDDLLIASQDVVLTDDEAFTGVSASKLLGSGTANNFFFGNSNPLSAAGGNGDDVYVISRYQTGDVDEVDDAFGANIMKFDFEVEISSARATGRGGSKGEILLGTDASNPTATVEWNAPTAAGSTFSWKYQIGNGAVMTWAEFLTFLGPTTGTALTTAYTVASLATDSVTEGNVASKLLGSSVSEVFSFGGDGARSAAGGNGDDTYVITRYQTGDVDEVDDAFGANIMKFDFEVEISSARATGRGGSKGEILLGTDASNPTATVEWNAPTAAGNTFSWQYQIGDGAVMSWADFLTALGPTTGTALTTPFTVPGLGLISPGSYTALHAVDSAGDASTGSADTLVGTAAKELIQGGNEEDTISTGGGDDVVIGGYGKDAITLSVDASGNGAANTETVVYRYNTLTATTVQAADGGDTISGFRRGTDKFVFVELGEAYHIGTDAITNADGLTDTYLSGNFLDRITTANAVSPVVKGVVMLITDNKVDGVDLDDGLDDADIALGGRLGVQISFSDTGYKFGLADTGGQNEASGSQLTIWFDAESSKWLDDATNWDTVTGGSGGNYDNFNIDSLAGFRALFGDTDTNDDLLQFIIAGDLGVDIL